jgi:large subunit ribosomal protein L29
MKTKQLQEIKNYSEQELLSLLEQKQKRLFEISAQKKIAPVKNLLEIRTLRRDIARIKTIFRLKFNRKI